MTKGGVDMHLTIDQTVLPVHTEESLLDLIRQAGMDSSRLSERPIAAKIAGEVFTLNYVPLRKKDMDSDRVSMRRAMAASNGMVQLLRYRDPAGQECYLRTAQFVIFLAMRQLWPDAWVKMNCTLGSSVYFQVKACQDFSVGKLRQRMQEH